MFSNQRLRLPLALVAGLMTAFGFAPADVWVVALLGTTAMVGLVDTASSKRSAAAAGWLWGFGMFAASLTWIATAFTFQSAMPAAMGWVAVLGLSAFLALYPMLAALMARAVPQPGLARLLVLAGAFMIAEWLRGVVLSGFSWNPLGSAWLTAQGIGQLARVIGAQGLSGLMILAGGGLWLLASRQRSYRHRTAGAGLLLLVMLGGVFGHSSIKHGHAPDNPTLIIVQPNIGQGEKYDEGANARHLERYLAITRQGVAESDTTADAGKRTNLIIWSESSVFGLPEEDPLLRRKLASVLRPQDFLLFGGVAAERDVMGNIDKLRNSLFVLDAGGTILARYDKAHLTPLGEYLPARGILEKVGLARLAPGGIDFAPGPGPKTIALPGIPSFGAMICYEIIFGSRVIEAGQRPAWIANISNDAWFGPTGPPQHLAQARLRAIEEGLPIARATPTGISAVIDPSGQLLAQQASGTSGFIRTTLPPPLPATPYAKFGDAIPLSLAVLLLLGGLLVRRRWPAI